MKWGLILFFTATPHRNKTLISKHEFPTQKIVKKLLNFRYNKIL